MFSGFQEKTNEPSVLYKRNGNTKEQSWQNGPGLSGRAEKVQKIEDLDIQI